MTAKYKKTADIQVLIQLDSTSRKVASSLTGKAIAARVAKDSKVFSVCISSKNKR